MSHIVVDMNNPTPPYEQVRREIIEQVRTGELTPGDKLPAIRVLAGDLGLAAGTVARAYKLLEEAQIIVTRRGAGTTVAPGAPMEARKLASTVQREAGGPIDAGLVSLFAGPVAAARARGARDVEILASVRAALAGESGERARGRCAVHGTTPPRRHHSGIGILELWPSVFGPVADEHQWRTRFWEQHRGRADFRLITAERGDSLLGFAWGYTGERGQWWADMVHEAIETDAEDWVGGHFEVVELAVDPEHQGQRARRSAPRRSAGRSRPRSRAAPDGRRPGWRRPSPVSPSRLDRARQALTGEGHRWERDQPG